MSNYGFTTFDEKSGKTAVSINSKWPIFGPNYSDIKSAFKTIHFTDTTQYDPYDMSDPSVVLPDVSNDNPFNMTGYHAYEKDLVATIPHGYKFRPVGYATISGKYVKNTRCVWDYSKVQDDFNEFPPDANLYGVKQETGGMISSAGGGISGISGNNQEIFYTNPWEVGVITYPEFPPDDYGYMTSNLFSIPGENSATPDIDLGAIPSVYRPPYSVEIDDTNVYIYRHWYWCDVWKRHKYIGNQLGQGWDVRARIKGVIDYAGSDFDVTIYLCPYNMEDLI